MINDQMLIGGQFVSGSSEEYLTIVNPATGEVVARYPSATAKDVDVAVTSAEQGFQLWRKTPTANRAEIMHRAAELVRQQADTIAQIITREMGKPLKEALSETTGVASLLDYFAEEGIRVSGDIPKMDLPNELPLVIKQPIGVVGAITPFNYPIALLTWKLGPALITGCSVVAKPDEHAPTPALMLGQALLDAGLPANVFNVITGGAETGKLLVSHPTVRKIAFTGSVEVGQTVGATALKYGKRVTLELGGQCPAIISNQADLNTVLPNFIRHTFNNAGQYCYRINRAYLEEGIYDDFMRGLIEGVSKIKVGRGDDPSVSMGPLTTEEVYNRTMQHISDAVSNGAKVRYGGKRITGQGFDSGFFFMPTVIDEANHSMLVMQEETFGPVVGIQKISSLRQGIQLANDTRYGLAAYVFTGDAGLGIQAAREIEAGSVWVDRVQSAYYPLPFGGMKQSGQGREKSKYGIDEYLEVKAVYLGLPELE